jgi:metallo-beta-lactamase family protein
LPADVSFESSVPLPRLTFLGAAGTVTGSKYLVETPSARFLIDCGLFQGPKEWRQRNWEPLPLAADQLDFVLLTHAHLDHSGYLPRLAAGGFRGPVYSTAATIDLCGLLLPDSGHLQEEDALYANKRGFSKHRPALPLYTRLDAEQSLTLLKPVDYGTAFEPAAGVRVRWREAGHLLGSAFLELDLDLRDGVLRMVCSGDVGRRNLPLLRDPELPTRADLLLLESTYGGRVHPGHDSKEAQQLRLQELQDVIQSTVSHGGTVVIPSFAIGRTQQLLFDLRELENNQRIPQIPVYVDSPMATDATGIFRNHKELFDAESQALLLGGDSPLRCSRLTFTRDAEASKQLNSQVYPSIIIAASGMATGGRVLHHLKHKLPDPRHTVAFAGFQAEGTRGRALIEGAREIKIHGETIPVRARVVKLEGFSSHGDSRELLAWVGRLQTPPRNTYLVHGEPSARAALAQQIETELKWKVFQPSFCETIALGQSAAPAAAHSDSRPDERRARRPHGERRDRGGQRSRKPDRGRRR